MEGRAGVDPSNPMNPRNPFNIKRIRQVRDTTRGDTGADKGVYRVRVATEDKRERRNGLVGYGPTRNQDEPG